MNNSGDNSGYHRGHSVSIDINDPTLSFNKDYDMTVEDTNMMLSDNDNQSSNNQTDMPNSDIGPRGNSLDKGPSALKPDSEASALKRNNIDDEDDYDTGVGDDLTSGDLRRQRTNLSIRLPSEYF